MRIGVSGMSTSAAPATLNVPPTSCDVVVAGAGIAGISAAYYLHFQEHVDHITIVDPRPAMSLTSCRSTECYRDAGFDSREMTLFMSRSIDLLEERVVESNNTISMTPRGYVLLCRGALGHVDVVVSVLTLFVCVGLLWVTGTSTSQRIRQRCRSWNEWRNAHVLMGLDRFDDMVLVGRRL